KPLPAWSRRLPRPCASAFRGPETQCIGASSNRIIPVFSEGGLAVTRYLVLAAFCFLTVPGLGEQPASLYSKLPVWPGDDNLPPASKDKYVFWDPATAEIVMSYPKDPSDPSGARTTYRYRPQNQVEPQISV